MIKIEDLEKAIKDNNDLIVIYKNNNYVLNEKLNDLKIKNCKLNIKKCYKKNDYYYMIIDIDDLITSMYGPPSFNEYVYKVIKFKYPYNDSLLPFEESEINLCPAYKNNYNEITLDEFNEKFNEVNQEWINKLK